jgi:hypothetical protein
VWVTKLPPAADLFDIEVLVDSARARQTYIGPPDQAGAQQINAVLPAGVRTGLVPVEVRWFGRTITRPAALRVIPAGPQIPRAIAISDGINLMSGMRIESGVVKVSVEELDDPDRFGATIAGTIIEAFERLCVEPQSSRWEFNFSVPEDVPAGPAPLELRVSRRRLAAAVLEIVR